MCVGKNIRRRRRELDITGQELGMAIGVTRAMISRYETGLNTPSITKINAIAKYLKTTVAELEKE